MDFKESGFMYAVALGVVAFVIAQSIFFIVKAWKRGKQLGLSGEKMKNTIVSSILFTIAPALSILVTVIVLANALGIVLPWIRLSVVGNLAYETIAAQSALEAMGGSINSEVTDPAAVCHHHLGNDPRYSCGPHHAPVRLQKVAKQDRQGDE